MPTEITQSELSEIALCPLKWHFKYNRLLRPKKKSVKLIVGSAVHAGVEAFYKREGDPVQVAHDYCQKVLDQADADGIQIDESYEVDLKKAVMLIKAYIQKYESDLDLYNVLSVESKFRVHLVDDIFLCGKIDRTMVEKRTGIMYPTETKTAAAWDSDVNRLMLDFQVSVYSWVFYKQMGMEAVTFLYDIIKKPMIKLRQNDTHDMFLARYESVLAEDPAKYFIRDKVSRSLREIKQTEEELVIRCRELVRRRNSGDIYRVPGDHCSWKCDHRALCLENTEDMAEALYIKVDAPHQELVPEEEKQE